MSRKLKLTVLILLVVFVLMLAVSACGSKTDDAEDTSTEDVVPDEVPKSLPETETDPEPDAPPEDAVEEEVVDDTIYDQLTGLPVEEDNSAQRPYAVMINNTTAAMPLLGVSRASILYETLVEGGITRMLAVFENVDDDLKIGSIRSSRHYYLDLAMSLDAIYICAGGSPQAYEDFYTLDLDYLDGVKGSRTDIYFRDSERLKTYAYEHTMVTTGELMNEYIPQYEMRHEHEEGYEAPFTFTSEPTTEAGEAAEKAIVYFSSKHTDFNFNAEDGLYYADEYGSPMTDGSTGEQVAVKNVIVLSAEMYSLGDSKGRINVVLTGSGSGYYICDGKYVDITWERESRTSQFELKNADGTELELARGKTYICIIPTDQYVTFE